MKSRKTLSQALNTEYISDLVPVNEEAREIVPAGNSNDAVEADEDFENVRMTLQELIKTGSIAISDIHSIAQNNEEARSFEVLATLIKTVSETADKLLDSHEKRKKIRNVEGKKLLEPEGGGVSIDKAVFVGTTSDLLRQLKSKDE